MKVVFSTLTFIWSSLAIAQIDSSKVGQSKSFNLSEVGVFSKQISHAQTNSPIQLKSYGQAIFKKNASVNLLESIQLINGVLLSNNCTVCNTSDIQINGLEGPYTLVLIDGMPIVSALSTVYGLSGIPTSIISSIELTKGPSSANYGSEAMGGIINIITKDASTSPRVFANYYASSHLEQNLDLSTVFKFKKLQTLLSANYFRFQNRLDANQDNFTDLASQNRLSVFAKTTWQRKPNLSANIALRVYGEDRFGGELNWQKPFRLSDSIYGESIYTKRIEVLADFPFLIAKQKLIFQSSANAHFQDAAYGIHSFIAKQLIAFNQLSTSKKFGSRHTVSGGLSLKTNYYKDNTPATANASNLLLNHTPGVFVQDIYLINSSNTLSVGARLDNYPIHGAVFSPRLNYLLKLGSTQSLRLSAGRGFRVVSIFTEDHAALTGAREVEIKQALKPEESLSSNIQFSKWTSKKWGYLEWDINLFYARFSNKIIPDYDSDPNKIIYANSSDHAVSRGLSYNIETAFNKPFKVNVGISFMDVYSVQKDSFNSIQKSAQIHSPKYSGTLQASYILKKLNLNIDYTASLTGPMRMPVQANDFRPSYSPAYSIHTIQVSKKWNTRFEGYLGVKNLLNFTQQNPIMRWWDPFDKNVSNASENPNGYTFDTAYSYASMQGRRLYVGVRINLQ
ncbi:MAG: TonB-dependent receptor [Bacteroidetes bacterium B1(2017)]|nr:MAG: TonB-dependent receptor [Bacteroidetes bacterium B1(2017)]